MSQLALYNYFRSSTSYRARIALHFKKLSFEYHPISLLKNENRSPEYLKINPMGGVPTLVHNNHIIPDSNAIIEYLEEVFPEHPLLPPDAYHRARIREVCQIINSSIHPMGNLKVNKHLETKYGFTQEQKEEWFQHWASGGFAALEIILKNFHGKFCFGDHITMADVYVVPQIQTALRFHVDMSKYPLLKQIFDHCHNEEAFKKAHPFRQVDTPDDLRIP
jgi:maleylacetoacetate isomerase/maleylpyruvate isomerase